MVMTPLVLDSNFFIQAHRVKIPDAAVPFGIKCVNTIEMFRILAEQF